jgi:hypothetical protein
VTQRRVRSVYSLSQVWLGRFVDGSLDGSRPEPSMSLRRKPHHVKSLVSIVCLSTSPFQVAKWVLTGPLKLNH